MFMVLRRLAAILVVLAPLAALTACGSDSSKSGSLAPGGGAGSGGSGSGGGGVASYTVGGTVSGLAAGASVVLLDNGGDAATVSANGPFTFKTALAADAAYAVTVATQPNSATCTVATGTGTVSATNITTVAVSCVANAPPPTYTIGGTVSGLAAGASVVLLDNGGDAAPVSANGAFTFKTALVTGAAYTVTVGTQPSGETCAVANGTGTLAAANVAAVAVSCVANAPPPTYTIGGTVSGLTAGTLLVLLDNGGGALTVSTTASFVFTTQLAAGATYAVTVGTQPSGQTCSVTNGAGTVSNANVTGIAVTCVANSSGGGSSGTGPWLAFQATPVANTTGGQTGLFVIGTGSLSTSTEPIFVDTHAANTELGFGSQISNYGTAGEGVSFPVVIYAGVGSDGMAHLYGLNLGSSTVPVERQISNFAVPSLDQVCPAVLGFFGGQTDLTDATTAFILIRIPGANGCSDSDPIAVVHFSDSSTTLPTPTGLTTPALPLIARINCIYLATGALGGIISLDSSGQAIDYYADDTFSNPRQILTGVSTFTDIFDTAGYASNSGAFVETGPVPPAGVSYTASYDSLYHITPSGTVTKVYSATGSLQQTVIADDNNFYFQDTAATTVQGSIGASTTILQEPISGVGTPIPLYTDGELPSFIGSNDSVLVFDPDFGVATDTLLTVPVGQASSTPNTLVGPSASGSSYGGLMGNQRPFSTNVLVYVNTTSGGGTSPTSYTSSIVTVTGAVHEATEANAYYMTAPYFSFDSALQIRGITDTSEGYGGGQIYVVDPASLIKTALTTPSGTPYVLPMEYTAVAATTSSNGGYTALVYAGSASPAPPGPVGAIAVFNLGQSLILPLTMTNTMILPLHF